MQTTIKPSKISPRPLPSAVHDSAPPLVSKGRKRRAKGALPEPTPLAAPEDMPSHERAVVEAAMAIIRARMRRPGERAASPQEARILALLHLNNLEFECFSVMFLDTQNRLIAFEEMMRGTLDQTTVYPREVVKVALRHNAAAAIFVHNHPSGVREPSQADISLTAALKAALALVDVKAVDHFIVAGDSVTSFAEHGLL